MLSNELQQIYDRFAETYDLNRTKFDVSEIFNDFYNLLTIRNGDALDLGCGAGEPFALWFIDRGWKVTGVDISEKMLELAKKKVPSMATIHADMCSVNFNPNSFDAIIASYSLFHVPSDKHEVMLEKFYRWLRPEGKALFTYANQQYTGSIEFDGYKEFMGEKLFYSHKTPSDL